MMRYKGVYYWRNDLQGVYLAQVGYVVVAKGATESAIKAGITRYLKSIGE